MHGLRGRDRSRQHLLPGPPPGDRQRLPGPEPRSNAADREAPSLTASAASELLVILGPTGTGKSAVAVRVAATLGGEIVGCDALQVYRGFDAATAKPDASDRAAIPHWLTDVADPRRDYSLADYLRDADAAIASIRGRGRVPIVVGGTGMYLRGLLKGIVAAPERDEALRARLRGLAARFGTARLHRWLKHLDPLSATRVPPGDAQRVIRALELALGSGANWSERLSASGTWSSATERYASVKFGLDGDREALAARLAGRVDEFFAAGLVDEVDRLLSEGVPATANAFKAIGYREVLAARIAGGDPWATRDAIVLATRRYAKRQRTWFRRERGVAWLDAARGPSDLAAAIVAAWRERRATGGAGTAC